MGGIGLERGRVRLAPHDPRWGDLFAEAAQAVRASLGARALGIEHVGSTAVPGLDAKPIIDLMVGLGDLRAAHAAVPVLEGIGYAYREAREYREGRSPAEYLILVKGPEANRTHHLRLNEYAGRDWTDQLLFRDHLRAHPEAAARYAALKLRLAAAFLEDRAAYGAGKEGLIREILAAARAAV